MRNPNELKVRVKNKIDYLSNWLSSNPILFDGELGFVLDNNDPKNIHIIAGNGYDRFEDLPYVNAMDIAGLSSDIQGISEGLSNFLSVKIFNQFSSVVSGQISNLSLSLSDYVPTSGDALIENDLSINGNLYVAGQSLNDIISANSSRVYIQEWD